MPLSALAVKVCFGIFEEHERWQILFHIHISDLLCAKDRARRSFL